MRFTHLKQGDSGGRFGIRGNMAWTIITVVAAVFACLCAAVICAYLCSRFLESRSMRGRSRPRRIEGGAGPKVPVSRRRWLGRWYWWGVDWIPKGITRYRKR